MTRLYLDWNATAPLRPEAKAAMIAAMEVVGNPSSVHAEGRAAKALLERARGQIAEALGADGADIVFTSGATEAAALACAGRDLVCAPVEHQAVAEITHRRHGEDLRQHFSLQVEHDTHHVRAVHRDAHALDVRIIRADLVRQCPQRVAEFDVFQIEHEPNWVLDEKVLELERRCARRRLKRHACVFVGGPDPRSIDAGRSERQVRHQTQQGKAAEGGKQ